MKLDQSVQVVNKKVTIGDIAQIQCSDYAVTKQINKIIALQVKGDKNQKKVISSLKLIELIRREIREAQIVLVIYTHPLIGVQIPFSNYGLTIYHPSGVIQKITLHMFDKNVDIEYKL